MATNHGVNLTIKGVDTENFRFISLQLNESVGASLPKLVATFIAGTENYNLNLEEVELNLTYLDHLDITFLANVDQIDFGQNNVILYMTAAPLESYQVNKNRSFKSLDEAINTMYWGEKLIKGVTDTSLLELNQVNSTDTSFLFRVLSSLSSPSCFSFGLGRLKITDLKDPRPTIFIDPKDETNYKVDMTDHSINKGKVKRLPYYNVPVMAANGVPISHMTSWGSKSIVMDSSMTGFLNNIIDNSKFYDRGNQLVRVIFKYLPDFMCGDIISISLMDIEATEFLVVERLALMKEDVEVSALLKPL